MRPAMFFIVFVVCLMWLTSCEAGTPLEEDGGASDSSKVGDRKEGWEGDVWVLQEDGWRWCAPRPPDDHVGVYDVVCVWEPVENSDA